jgi:uncharacterized protein (DUF2461 family)
MCHMADICSTALSFFAELEADNTKDFWTANRVRYDATIRPGFLRLLDNVEGFGPFRVYRPNNDTRFGALCGPYKTFIGGVAERPDGVGVFIQISSKGLLVGSGVPMPPKDQLENLRRAVSDDASGPLLKTAIAAAEAAGARIHGGRWDALQRVPKGFPADHPRADLLRWKGLEVNSRDPSPSWLGTANEAKQVNALIERGEAVHAWLGRYVGPTSLSPEERFAPKRR